MLSSAASRHFRRLLLPALAGTAALLCAGAGSASAAACGSLGSPLTPINITPSCFESGDGDMTAGTVPGGTDWSSYLTGAPTLSSDYVTTDGTGATDDTFVSGSKEEDPANWKFTQSPSSPKDDLLAAAKAGDTVSGDAFTYLGAIRKGNSGSMDLSFEFNQEALPGSLAVPSGAGGPTYMPGRKTGDVLIAFDTNGGVVSIGGCIWKGTATTGAWYLLPTGAGASPAVPADPANPQIGTIALDDPSNPFGKACTPLSTTTTPAALGAVNTAPIAAGDNVFTGDALAADQFAELSVDLSKALSNPLVITPCFNFGSVWMRTRSSNQVGSNPEDIVLPKALHVSSCTISGTKYLDSNDSGTQDAGENVLAGWKYELYQNVGGVWTDTGQSDITDSSGSYSFDNVQAGDYRVKELGHYVSPADSTGTFVAYADTSYVCTEPGETAASGADPRSCVSPPITIDPTHLAQTQDFGNFLPSTLTIAKTATPSSGTFDFTVGGPDPSAFGPTTGGVADVSVDAGSDTGAKTVPVGTYRVTETGAHSGTSGTWVLDSISCPGATSVDKHVADGYADVTLGAGDNVTCTFANVEDAVVTVDKTEGGQLPLTRSWDFTLSPKGGATGAVVHPDPTTGVLTFDPVAPGDYDLCEVNIPSGWETTLGSISSGSACQPLPLAAGDTPTIAADNLHPHVTVTKTQADADLPAGTPGKSATHDPIAVHVGDTVSYSVDVHNDGNSTLTFSSALDESNCDSGTLNGPSSADLAAGLAPGADWVFTCTYVVTGNEPSDAFSNTASATMHDSVGPEEVSDGDTVDATVLKPAVSVVKQQKIDGGSGSFTGSDIQVHVGDVIDYAIDVTNTSNTGTTLSFAGANAIADPNCDSAPTPPSGVDLSSDTLASGHTWTFTCSHTVVAGDGNDYTNTFTATGTDAIGGDKGTATDGDSVTADILKPSALLLKTGVDYVHHGDTITYSFKVTNNGNVTLTNVYVDDSKCPGNPSDPNPLGVGESVTLTCDVPVPDHTADEENPIHNVATAHGTDPSGAAVVSPEASADARILHPHVSVDKKVRNGDSGSYTDGPVDAYVGDVLNYQIVITNDGGDGSVPTPLTVSLSDPGCTGLQGPAGVTLGSSVLPSGQSWTFTCSHTVTAGDGTSYKNVATATGVDQLGGNKGTVTASDEADAHLLHPAVTLDKTGPATATAGDVVTYALTAKNTGDDPFSAPLVVLTDKQCEAPPVLVAINGDASPATFDPGDTWIYACKVQTQAGQTAVHNVGSVDAQDVHGRHATASDPADTTLTQPQIAVLPETIKRASAKLRGPQGCMSTSRQSQVVVTGKRIAKVTFYVGGRKVKTLTTATNGRFVLKITAGKLSYGSHSVRAVVRFQAHSTLKSKTLRMRINRCRAVVLPEFTG